MKELLEEDALSAYSATGLPIALKATPPWDIFGIEGENMRAQ
jgi:hypothetical protein